MVKKKEEIKHPCVQHRPKHGYSISLYDLSIVTPFSLRNVGTDIHIPFVF